MNIRIPRTARHCLVLLTALSPSISLVHADTTQARQAYTEWARVMTQLSREQTDWMQEKTTISDTIAAGNAELAAIDQRIAELKASSTEADTKRAAVNEKIAAARSTAEGLAARVSDFEQKVRALLPLLPEIVRAELAPAIQSLPDNPATTKVPLYNRAANVVMLLAQIDKFNSNINLLSEIRDLGNGRTVEVKTLYFGLAAAYFADASLTTAGYGSPGPQGWEWKPAEPATAQQIGLAIAMHENTRPPAFVELPVVIR